MSRLPIPAPPTRRVSSTGRLPPVPLRADESVLNDNAMRSLSRAVVALGMNALNPSVLPGDYARRNWPNDRDLPLVLRAAIGPASTADTPEMTFVAQALLATLVPMSASADLLRRGLSLEFAGAASISIPGIVIPAADFVGEGEAIPTTEAPTADVRLERFKLAVITSATSEMMHSANAAQLIKTVLVEATGPALDRALLSVNPASPERPAGLLNGIAPLPAGANLVDNLVAVVSSVAPVAGNGAVAVIVSPTQSVAINLLLPRQPPFAVLTSATLASGTLIACALNSLVSAVAGPPQIDASVDALVHMETGPRQDIGGGIMAVPLRSYFQSDTVGLKLRWPISWALRDARGIAWVQ